MNLAVDLRSGDDRRSPEDRRKSLSPIYNGAERRSGVERRSDNDRRRSIILGFKQYIKKPTSIKPSYTVSVEPEYILVREDPNFVMTPQNLITKWKQIAEICQKHSMKKILIEGCPIIREIYTINFLRLAEYLFEIGIFGFSIVFLLSDYEPEGLIAFLEKRFKNRGNHVKFCTDKQEALQWLNLVMVEEANIPCKQ